MIFDDKKWFADMESGPVGEGGKVEPSADQRGMANMLFGQYTAFVEAGFSEDQAFDLINSILTTGLWINAREEES